MANSIVAAERRAAMDAIAWETLDSHVPPVRPEGYRSSRPSNYRELLEVVEAYVPFGDEMSPLPGTWPAFEHAWSEFLHEFYYWKQASFFEFPPPEALGPVRQVLLAGAAEYLCRRYGLAIPEWVNDPRYELPEVYDMWGELSEESLAERPLRLQRTPPEFLLRNLIFEARSLITP